MIELATIAWTSWSALPPVDQDYLLQARQMQALSFASSIHSDLEVCVS